MSPTPQSAWVVPQKTKKCGQKALVFHFSVIELEKNVTSWEIFRKILVRVRVLLIDGGAVKKNLAHSRRKNKSNHLEPHFQTSATKSRCLEDTIFFHFSNMHQTHARARKGSKTSLTHFLREMPYPSKTFRTPKGNQNKCLKACLTRKKFACGGLYGACLNPFLACLSR